MGIFDSFFKPDIEKLKQSSDLAGLTKALSHKKPEVRFNAAVALGELKDSRSVEALVAALSDSSPKVRSTAAAALGELKQARSVDGLVDALSDEDARVRVFVAANLIKIGGQKAEEAVYQFKKQYCAECGKSLQSERDVKPLPRGSSFAAAVQFASQVLGTAGRKCKCGATICAGCLPVGGGRLSCPFCGSSM